MAEQAARIAVQSYETDPALLAALRSSRELGAAAPAGAIRLTDRLGVAFSPLDAGAWAPTAVTRDGDGWRPARPGDGISAFVAGVPMASERPIAVDQTHASVVVGERAIVKWFRRIGPGPSRAATLLAHLDAVGFDGTPRPLGALTWRAPDGVEHVVAQGDAFLPGARDGWEWCVERAAANARAAETGAAIGALVAALHLALGTPSPVIPEPDVTATPPEVAGWRRAALATLDEAIDLTDGPDGEALRSWAPAMRSELDGIQADGAHPLQPVHGDLHVGQALEWPGGLAVIDFDGNPSVGDAGNALRQPVERDLAQLAASLDHVGRVVGGQRGDGADPAVETWIAAARAAFLAAVEPHDERLRAAFEVEQECRELVYAARYLPRWRPAPMATLRKRFGS